MATRSSNSKAKRVSRSADTAARKPAHTSQPPSEPQPITFIVRGAIDAAPPATPTRGGPPTAFAAALPAGLLRGEVRHSLRLPALRSAAAGSAAGAAETRVEALPGRDVVVLHVAGGPSLVLHPENARALLRAQRAGPATRAAAHGDDEDDEVTVSGQLVWSGLEPVQGDSAPTASRGATRGLLGNALLSGLEIISGVAGEQLAAGTAAMLAARIDAKVDPGLHALQAGALLPLKNSNQPAITHLPSAVAAAGPLLVFVHGTFSSTAAFVKLWTQHPQRVAALFTHYAGRIYGFEHATLAVSPVANALALARTLPKGARLHLVTHSRGGLVAEVLARVAANPTLQGEDLGAFGSDDRRDLAALGTELGRKNIRIERVVRVACPARGTLLASKRLDAYLSVFKWTLELAAVPVLPELVDFLAAVAQQRTSPDTLPGLAAQVPDSALIQWLHAAAEPLPGDLRVVAGDVQGDSVGSWLKTLVADGFYWTDNDFVVQTRSMYGGAPRAGGALFMLDRGGKVTHGEYFGNERSAEAVCSALMHDKPEGFGVIGPLSWQGESSSGTRGRAMQRSRGPATAQRRGDDARPPSDKPAVILLPGICGSHLAVDGKRIWLNLRIVGGLTRLAWPDAPGSVVLPDGAIGPCYDDLAEHLADTHEVIEFSYDWRRPIEDEARRLAGVAEAAFTAREQSGRPVRFIAHSMGGLVVRTLALVAPALWTQLLGRPGARVLMLGTPNAGSWAPMQVLSGDDTFGNTLTAFGAPFQDHAARQLMARMPGFLQLQTGLTDATQELDQSSTWQTLADADLKAVQEHNRWHSEGIQLSAYRWGVPPQAVLDAAKAFREALDAQRERDLPRFADKLLLVVGRARFTPDGVVLGYQGLEYNNAVEAGDGRVTRASALLPGVRTWAVDCGHGGLADFDDAFAGYTELLETGSTSDPALVEQATPATRGGSRAADVPAPVQHVRSRPSRQPRGFTPPERESAVGDPSTDTVDSLDSLLDEGGGAARAAQGTREPALAVSVVNGNLMFMRQPLLIGHYRSTLLTGTEAVLNGLIGGGMQLALLAGIYPDQPGTHQMFRHTGPSDNPLQLPRPEWAIVVGLGDESELKPAGLVHSVRQAIINWGQRIVENPAGAPATFELAATLIGSGGTGITPGQSAQLIAQAGREANRSLAVCGWPLLAQLHLVELYLDRASEAWRGLQVLAAASPSHWRIAPQVKAGAGALRRPLDTSYRGAEYDLISAQSRPGLHGDSSIDYTLDTKRARAELRSQATQAGLVRELVQRASTDRNRDARIGHSLYQLLIPAEMDPFLGGTTEMRIKLDRGTAGIPWELLQDGRAAGGDPRPWSVRTKLMRTLVTADFRRQPRDANSEGGVLVIGEPALPPATGDSGYGRLPGARAEAQAVVDAFSGTAGPEAAGVKALIADGGATHTTPDAQQVINALLERDWQIVHIAGHGAPPVAHEKNSEASPDGKPTPAEGATRGVVLSHGFLGPSEIKAMRTVPELVFVNCCFLAQRHAAELLSGPDNLAQFASTVADALINLGVRCVIAAGWAVEDGPAEVFATTFYAALLRGQRFIDAAAQAREKAWEANRDGNTWAAYQCYGDPNWTLRRDSAKAPKTPPAERFAGISSPLGLCLALETVAVDARYVRGVDEAERERRRQVQRQRLAHLEGRFGPLWGGMGAVAEALALAWSELGEMAPAIAWYQRAVGANDGSASQKAAEQLANLRVRQAEGRVAAAVDEEHRRRSAAGAAAGVGKRAAAASAGKGASGTARVAALARLRGTARREIRAALQSIERLIALAPTMERQSLAGSAYKRLAMIETDAGRERDALAAIARMKQHTVAAEKIARASASPDFHYPALSRLAAELASDGGRADWNGFDAGELAEVRRSLADHSRDDPDFWSVVGLTDLRLFESVAARRLAREAEPLAAEYRALHKRVSAPRDWRSVHDTARFVLDRYAPRAGSASEAEACAAILGLLESFAWPDGV